MRVSFNLSLGEFLLSSESELDVLETFRKLDNRMTRYYPFLLELYPTPESRPRQHEALIDLYRKGKIAEALQTFKKIYLEIVDDVRDHLEAQESAKSVD